MAAGLPPGRTRWNDFRSGDLLVFNHGGVSRACRVVSPPWSDNTGIIVEIEVQGGRVVRCHDSDLEFPTTSATRRAADEAGGETPPTPPHPASS